jgi:hypothetical protein
VRELLVDFITTLDGYASAEGWPGWWGLQGPEYLAWLGEQPEVTYLMGAKTYRVMSSFAAGETPPGTDEEASVSGLTRASKVVFSASLEEPLTWANTVLVRGDAAEAVRGMKDERLGCPDHDRQHQPVPLASASRARRSIPGRDVPGDHRCHGLRTHLRRLPRRGPRDDRQSHL